ncbi:MAG TPA: hypothetical protein VMD76_13740 [Candidatus Sulfotelmatobacter sp.]|nr:hypothetical protein [Candidatus Sulfotelmatobacter sp.]
MILLVVDDPLQAHVALSLLGGQFGELHRAADAADALCLLEQPEFANKLSLVICGLYGKSFGAPEFVAELHRRKPDLRVLVLGKTGESANDYSGEHVTFLPYPLDPLQLVSLTRKMLAAEKRDVA